MSAYLGPLGQLAPIQSSPGMSVSGVPARAFEVTAEGRVKAQVARIGRREWSLKGAAIDPQDVGVLTAFALGEWGLGPFVWVSPTAAAKNLLPPEVALCGPEAAYQSGVSISGPLALPDGTFAGRSLTNSTPAVNAYFGQVPAPVLPRQAVTASAYVVGAGAQVGVGFYTAAGAALSSALSPATGAAGLARRLAVTATAPDLAAYARIFVAATQIAARPALTWSTEVLPWHSGEGCPKAIVLDLSRTDSIVSFAADGRRDAEVEFTIKEVG